MDGLVSSKHEVMPGLTELKRVNQPVALSITAQGTLLIENRYNFTDLEHLAAAYKLEELYER